MRRTTVLAATLIAAAISGASAGADPDFSADRIKAHVTFLADDLLEGREAGTRGHEIAARYVASQFALLGLKPGGRDGTYFEPVELLESSLTGPRPTLTLTRPGASPAVLKHGTDVVIVGPVAGGSVRLRAPLVFAGYGMEDAALGYDDYRGLDVKGKVAVVLYGSPKGMDSEIGAHLMHEQARVAAEHGATGMIRVTTRVTEGALPWQKMVHLADRPTTTWVGKEGKPFDPDYGLQASVAIDPRAAAALFTRAPQSLEQVLDEADQNGGRPTGFALTPAVTIAVATRVRRFPAPRSSASSTAPMPGSGMNTSR